MRSISRGTASRLGMLSPLLVAAAIAGSTGADEAELDLSGSWRFRLDPNDAGVTARWYTTELPQPIALPGSLQQQGYGDEVRVDTPWTGQIVDPSFFQDARYEPYRQPGAIQVPFWLQPDKHYVGAAWYQRTIQLSAERTRERLVLHLERPHWTTRAWLDDRELGFGDSLSTPHEHELPDVEPGQHRLTIRVDNRMVVNVGPNSHSVSDHTQSNWNGIVGRIALREEPREVSLRDVQVYPDVKTRSIRVVVQYASRLAAEAERSLALSVVGPGADPRPAIHPVRVSPGEGRWEATHALGERAELWDEFSPQLHELSVQLGGEGPPATRAVRFGLREFSTRGTQFTLNGRPIFLRGTLECCIFPRTGYPPTDVEAWQRICRILKAHGLNHLRFHSWCPPEAAFTAADEAGVLLHVECASWANQGSRVGDGDPIDAWITAEADRVLRWYGNHPSFVMMAYGNEPAGANQKRFLGGLVNRWKQQDPRRLYTSAAGWPLIPENQYHITPDPRIHAWGSELNDRLNALPPATTADYREFIGRYAVPVVSHEIGQWCVYPNFREIAKYQGVLQAKNFEIFRDFLEGNHLGDLADEFLMASGRLQTLCYKEEIESALRTPGMGGFQLLDLHDFPGQGTALVGVLDPFWDSKPYVSPREYHRFACETVPLARLAKRTWTVDETFAADAELAHYGSADLDSPVVTWRLETAAGQAVAEGHWRPAMLPTGQLSQLGRIESPLAAVAAPQRLNLVLAVEGTDYANDWEIWVYPAAGETDQPADVLIASAPDDAARKRLEDGGKVLLLPAAGTVRGDRYGKIPPGFSSIFWNTAWTRRQAPHTLGILCDPAHPALRGFPTAFHSDWQWWDPVTRSQVLTLDSLPPELAPIVRVIDDWFTCRRLGLVFEARVGQGRLLVCGVDLSGDLSQRPAARQLCASLLDYLASDAFDPRVEVEWDSLRSLFRPPTNLQSLGATISASSFMSGYPASQAADGDESTIWHTPWGDDAPAFPHHLVLDLSRTAAIAGIRCLPRQNMSNGWITAYEVLTSDDGQRWTRQASGTWPADRAEQRVPFSPPVSCRFIKLVATRGHDGKPFAALAELDVELAPANGQQ